MKLKKTLIFIGIGCSIGLYLFKINGEGEKKNRSPIERKIARSEYFFNKLKDPVTNTIPPNVRARELAFSGNMKNVFNHARTEKILSTDHIWNELGPSNVGGRTRAICMDIRNSNIVLAAGVSGGIWKTVDGGNTWRRARSLIEAEAESKGWR